MTNRVLKSAVIRESVLVEDPAEVEKRRQSEAKDIVAAARKTAEKLMADSFEAIRKEREACKQEVEGALSELEDQRAAILSELEVEAKKRAEEQVMEGFRPRVQAGVDTFETFIHKTEGIMSEVLEDHRNELVDLALGIAEKIVGHVSERDKDLVKRTALKCIEAARDRQEMVVRVNPEDLEIAQDFQIELVDRFDDLKKLSVEADRRVDRGGAWIETPTGFIDGRIRSQIEEVFASVLPESENPRSGSKGESKPEDLDEGNEAIPGE